MKLILLIILIYTPCFANQFTADLTFQLESVYGQGMMSAGGENSVDRMFDSIELNNKKILDFGSGLGGPARYLAKKFQAEIVGIDCNERLVKNSNENVEEGLLKKVHFVFQDRGYPLPFQNEEFDLIYSKEVLTHVKRKDDYFREFNRILKSGHQIVITDWLSQSSEWGSNMQTFLSLQGAQMYPMTISAYLELFENSGFEITDVRSENKVYLEYYNQILSGNLDQDVSISYQAIFNALQSNELQITRFIAEKVDRK